MDFRKGRIAERKVRNERLETMEKGWYARK